MSSSVGRSRSPHGLRSTEKKSTSVGAFLAAIVDHTLPGGVQELTGETQKEWAGPGSRERFGRAALS